MKQLLKNAILKKILIVLIIIIMTSNFIMPSYVNASVGDDIVIGICHLAAYIGDAALSIMQKYMTGSPNLKEYEEWAIKYSPGLIFSNTIAPLKINFISASSNDDQQIFRSFGDVQNRSDMLKLINRVADNNIQAERVEYSELPKIKETYTYTHKDLSIGWDTDDTKTVKKLKQGETKDGIKYSPQDYTFYVMNDYLYLTESYSNTSNYNPVSYKDYYRFNLLGIRTEQDIVTVKSVANELKSEISKWYKALRTVALVGLLSVLVYIGIRIILSSSSAQDKSKYKNMLKDWLVALCILFVLHYVMAFMLGMVDTLNSIVKGNVIEKSTTGNNVDVLMTEMRKNVEDDKNKAPSYTVAGYTIMYLALVILTGVFTVQYLKRVVLMAFLTMIAPLIALTYPLDKIKDSKAQAFSYWLREYIFNCLIQPVHLVIYMIFICSARNIAKINMLYAIVALSFMVPAEKIIKEMFGIKSQSPTNTLGAAAGGAMVMSMLQKMRGKPPKPHKEDEGSGGGARTGRVRTATGNQNGGGNGSQQQSGTPGTAPLSVGGAQNRAPITISPNSPANNAAPAAEAMQNSNGTQTPVPGVAQPQTANSAQGTNPLSGREDGSQQSRTQVPTPVAEAMQSSNGIQASKLSKFEKIKKGASGVGELGKRYIYGPNALKSHLGKFTGVVGAGVGATIGIAAGVATGDLEGAVKNAGIGAAAGYAGGNNLAQNVASIPGGIKNIGSNISDTFNKGYLTQEEYQNRAFDKKFFQSDEYKLIAQDKGIEAFANAQRMSVKDLTQGYLNNGVTDASQIRVALQNGIKSDEYKTFADAGMTDAGKMKEALDAGITANEYTAYAESGIKSTKDIEKLRNAGLLATDMEQFSEVGETNANRILKIRAKYANETSENLANLFKLAKHAPKTLEDFKSMMIGRTFNGVMVTEDKAEEIFKQLVDFF